MDLSSKRRWQVGWRLLACVISGGLLASAFPPIEGSEAAWVALVPILLIARFSGPWAALRWGFLSGMAFWLCSLTWLLQLGRTGVVWPVAVLCWVGLAAYCSIYNALFLCVAAGLFKMVYRADGDSREDPSSWGAAALQMLRNVGLICAVSLAWVGSEYLRSVLFTGFPWNQLGVSQYRNLAVIQLAEWGGVYAVSAVVMIMNAAITMMLLRMGNVYLHRQRTRFQVELAFGLLVCVLCWSHGIRVLRKAEWRHVDDASMRVALVQPNIEQLKKWSNDDIQIIYDNLERYTDLALNSKDKIDLVVWPETALPGPLKSDPEVAAFVRGLATNGVPMLLGSMQVIPGDPNAEHWLEANPTFFNSSFLVDANGEIIGEYNKRHLVPFGEYLPFDRRFKFMHDLAPLGFSCKPGETSTVFRVNALQLDSDGSPKANIVPFSTLICFEDTVASLARASVLNGARALVVQTNDAWFDPSAGSLQHLSHCVFRSVENRVAAARCANTGISCLIERTGNIKGFETENWLREAEAFDIVELDVGVLGMNLTFYTRYGDLPFAIPSAFFTALGFVLVVVRERRKNGV